MGLRRGVVPNTDEASNAVMVRRICKTLKMMPEKINNFKILISAYPLSKYHATFVFHFFNFLNKVEGVYNV